MVCCLILVNTCWAHAFQADQIQQRQNLESFELIWNKIRDNHWDESLVGDSWTTKREELLPRIKASTTIEEARAVMAELLDSLEQSHFQVLPSESYEAIEGVKGGRLDIGLTVRLIGDELIVVKVRKGSTSESAGVKAGWQITKLRNKSATELIESFRNAEHGPQRAETIAGLTVARMLSGGAGKRLSVEFVDGQDVKRNLKIACEQPPGKMFPFGNLPPIRVDEETKTFPGNVGYYRFSAFLDPMRVMPAWRKAIKNPQHDKGFVIDLRGNIGGIAGMTMGMASAFSSQPTALGTITQKGSKLKLVTNRVKRPYKGPVAVLVDECSISSSEILAGGLQDLKMARVFGQRTAGLAYPSLIIKLPNGDGFQYAFADYHSASGARLEKTGVVPDVEIELNRDKLLANEDPVLQAALDWISSKNQQ